MPAISRAIVRPPGRIFAKGLTSASLGAPDFVRALEQHASYCDAFERRGVEVAALEPSDAFPDSTFVEDVAVIVGGRALLTRPGAPTRRGETDLIGAALRARFSDVGQIESPGTLDGGDVCETEDRCYVGISSRTNPSGAEQFARWLERAGKRTEIVDIRRIRGLLHLKSAMAYVGRDTFVIAPPLRTHPAFLDVDAVLVDEKETYAADCLAVNDAVFVPAGFPRLAAALRARGFTLVELDMSEFEKMDGGLSCLSLRF